MAIYNIYSKRNKKKCNNQEYIYDNIPQRLRIQIIHIWSEITKEIDSEFSYSQRTNCIYEMTRDTLRKEYGVFSLTEKKYSSAVKEVHEFLLLETNIDKILDVIELLFIDFISLVSSNATDYRSNKLIKLVNEAINELNIRFKEDNIGYQLEKYRIIRMDSEFHHQDIVKPVIMLLHNSKYSGPENEFQQALSHHKSQKHIETILFCRRALESQIRKICECHKWNIPDRATLKTLINTCFKQELIPVYLQNQFSCLEKLLESGVPTLSNKESCHVETPEVREVDPAISSLAIHLTASIMLFLAQLEIRLDTKKV